MTKNQIKGYLLAKDYTLTRVGKEVGAATAQVSCVVAGRYTSRKIMIRIAEILGKPPAEVFPRDAHLFTNQPIAQNGRD
ncbi:MAG: helix-turn-helix domain-containing protein [Pseudomonadota bacterium]